MAILLWTTDRNLQVNSSSGGGLAESGLELPAELGRFIAALGDGCNLDAVVSVHRSALDGRSGRMVFPVADQPHELIVAPHVDASANIVGCITCFRPLDESAGHRLQANLAAQEAIARILQATLEPISFAEQLERTLDILLEIPWLGPQPSGAIFMYKPSTRALVLEAQRGLPEPVATGAQQPAIGTCFCGRPFPNQQIRFARLNPDDLPPHAPPLGAEGHYCVPIIDGEPLGVLNLFLQSGAETDIEVDGFLATVAKTIAGTIKHVRMAEALRQSEERFALAVEGSDAGIWDWSLRTNEVFFSRRWKRMLGYADNELRNHFDEWEQRLHPDDRPRALTALHQYLEGHATEYELEHRLRHKDGTYRWILARGAALRDADGRPYRMAGSQIDITTRKLADQKARENEVQLVAAQRIQQHFLPSRPPASDWLDLAGASRPAAFAGGDLFDFLPLAGGAMGCLVGDVSGHGVASSLLMASTHAFLHSLAETCATIEEMVVRVNEFVVRETDSETFVTLLLTRFDPIQRTLTWINAGHPTGYVLDRSGTVKQEMPSVGMPLGIRAGGKYPTSDPMPLEPGDITALLTDGIFETFSSARELFGRERAIAAIRVAAAQTATEILDVLFRTQEAYAGDSVPHDDRTAVIVKVR